LIPDNVLNSFRRVRFVIEGVCTGTRTTVTIHAIYALSYSYMIHMIVELTSLRNYIKTPKDSLHLGKMGLSEARTREIVLGYLQREARRNRQPRQITVRETRQLQTWLVVFWLNQDLQARISRFLRLGGGFSGRRRADMHDYLLGRDQETDKYEDKGLQVSLISRPGAI
jgi:hypothetical protein